jgi:pimeloyl-ACP methyl ester carboxylesterase
MRALKWTRIVLASMGFMMSGQLVRGDDSQTKGTEQIWEGTLKVRPGIELRLVIHARLSDGTEPVATLDSPDEGFSGLKLSSVVIDQTRLAFEVKVSDAKYEGKLNAAGIEATGNWIQRGASLPLNFVKKDKETPAIKAVGNEQIWEGKLGLNAGLSLRLVVRVQKSADGGLLGNFQSPDQSPQRLKLDSVILDKTKLAFALKAIGVTYEGKLNAEESEAVGTFTQGGTKLALSLKKTDKATELRRPQTPKPPFPYKVEELKYRNERAGITLAGTLTIPEGRGPFPAVILISGSGAQDRDETIFAHKPFLVLADMLTRRGVAVLRVDDRGVGGSSGNVATATSEEFAGDVEAGIAVLKSRRGVDGQKIGLIGHSEGGLIAPIVAARSRDVAFIVLLAGTGLPGEEIMMMQGRLIGKAMGASDKDLDKQHDLRKRLFEIMKTEPDAKKAGAAARQELKKLLEELPPEKRKEAGDIDSFADSQTKMLESPWFRFFLTFDPRPTLAKVQCPVLALDGEKDLQVPPKENLEEIAKAIKSGGNTHVTTQQLPGLNHLFQTCKTGSVAEYSQIEETIAPAALKVIGDWVVKQSSGGD